jgi:WD40 repeat protein/tetratricopeptide (TPR) repeat protein
LLTLRSAFAETDRNRLVQQVTRAEPPRPRSLNPEVPRDLETVILKAIEREPARRYQTAADFGDDLRRFAEDRPIRARRMGNGERLWRWCRRHPAVATLTAAVALLLVGVTVTSAILAVTKAATARNETRLREDAEGERGKADRARENAEAVEKENRTLVARQYGSHGGRLLEEGNWSDALLWFVEALKKDRDDPERAAMHRRRIAVVSQLCPRPAHVWFHPGPVSKAEYSPDSRRVATISGRDGKRNEVRLWDAVTGQKIGEPLEHRRDVWHLVFNSDGSRLLTLSGRPVEPVGVEDGEARLWDADTGRPLTPPLEQNGLRPLPQFSLDGRRFLTVSGVRLDPRMRRATGGEARLWDAATGKQIGPALRQDQGVFAALFSPRGDRVLTVARDATGGQFYAWGTDGQLWDAGTGRPVGPQIPHVVVPTGWPGPGGFPRGTPFSPDGKRLIAVPPGDQSIARVQVWDAVDVRPLGPWLLAGQGSFHELSPDGRRRLVTTSGPMGARLWDAATGRAIAGPMLHDVRHDIEWTKLAAAGFSPDSGQVVTLCNEPAMELAEMRLWDARTGAPRAFLQLDHAVQRYEFSPDGTRLLVTHLNKTARVWDTATGRPLTPPLKHEDQPISGAFSPAGRWLLTWGGTEARVWDPATGRPLTPLLKHGARVTAAAFSPAGGRVLTASEDGTARVWPATAGEPPALRFVHEGLPTEAELSADGTRLWSFRGSRGQMITAREGEIRLWDAGSGKQLDFKRKGFVNARFSPDGRSLVTWEDSGGARVPGGDIHVQLWDAATGRAVAPPATCDGPVIPAGWYANVGLPTKTPQGLQLFGSVNSVPLDGPFAFSPDSRLVAFVVTRWDGRASQVRVWERDTGRELSQHPPKQWMAYRAYFSPAGRLLVGGDNLATKAAEARYFDPRTGQPLGPPLPGDRILFGAAFSRDGRLLVTCGKGSALQVREARAGEPLGPPILQAKQLFAGTFTTGGRRLLTVTGRFDLIEYEVETRLWDTATGQPLLQEQGRGTVSADGRRVAVRTGTEARVWDAETGSPLTPPLHHPLPVLHAELSPDGGVILTCCDSANREGRTVESASTRGEVRLWDAATGELLSPPLPHAGTEATVRLSADGLRLLFAPDGRALALWDLPGEEKRSAEELTQLAGALSGRLLRDSGRLDPLGPADFEAAWRAAHAARPESFPAPAPDPVAWHRRQANLYEQVQDWAPAAWHLGRLIAAEPKEVMLYRRRGLCCANLGRWEETISDTDKAIELGADVPGPWTNKGLAHFNLGQLDEAAAALEKAVAYRDSFLQSWVGLARVRAKQGDAAGCRRACNGVLDRLTPAVDGLTGYWAVWACAVAPGGLADPERLVKEARRIGGDGLAQGAALYRAGQWQQAVDILDVIERMPAGRLQAPHRLFRAMAHARLGRPDLACADFEEAAAALDRLAATGEPQYVSSYGGLMKIDALLRGDLDLVRREADALLGAPHAHEAAEALRRKRWEEAVSHQDAILAADPAKVGAFILRGRCHAELRRYDRAAADFARAIELGANDGETFAGLGVTRALADDADGYRRDCKRLLDTYDRTVDRNLAGTVADFCKYGTAAPEDLARAVKLAENCVALYFRPVLRDPNQSHAPTVGALLCRAGRFEEAVAWLEEGRKVRGTEDGFDSLFLALAHQGLFHADEARRHLDRAGAWIDQQAPEPGDWQQALLLSYLRSLRREAEAVLGGKPQP